MRTNTLISATSGLPLVSISLLLIVSFSLETSAKRGCATFGHSCLGGHGKRSNPDVGVGFKDIEVYPASTKDDARDESNNEIVVDLGTNGIAQLGDFVKCRNCAMESSRRARNQQNYIPLLVRQLLASYRRPYNADPTPNDM